MAKKRGEWGSIFLRGDTFWIKYYKNGKPYRESSQSNKKQDAKDLLIKRYNEIQQGKEPTIRQDRVRFDDLAKSFIDEYVNNERKSLQRAEISVGHLKKSFEGMRAVAITTPVIQSYIRKRKEEEGAANATINRELAALKRMLMLGAKCTPPLVDRVPYIPMLKENNVKKGFFEQSQFDAVRDLLPFYLQGIATFAYRTGWRKGEVLNLQWSQVDREKGIVCLNPGETKNDAARTVYMDEELKAVFEKQWAQRKELAKRISKVSEYVFTNEKGTDRVRNYYKAWKSACAKAGLAGRVVHDFRRTASRNLVRAGVPERVAMMITGHKTRSVFDRYNIVNDEDLRLAAVRQEAYLKDAMGTKTGTVLTMGTKKRSNQNG